MLAGTNIRYLLYKTMSKQLKSDQKANQDWEKQEGILKTKFNLRKVQISTYSITLVFFRLVLRRILLFICIRMSIFLMLALVVWKYSGMLSYSQF